MFMFELTMNNKILTISWTNTTFKIFVESQDVIVIESSQLAVIFLFSTDALIVSGQITELQLYVINCNFSIEFIIL